MFLKPFRCCDRLSTLTVPPSVLPVFLAAVLLSACPVQPSEPCTGTCGATCWGDLSSPAEVDVGMLGPQAEFLEISAEDQPVDLQFAPQGGHVLFVAARIRNMPACNVTLRARLLDPDTRRVVTEEARRIHFIRDGGKGGLADLSDLSNVANVPVCPNFGDQDFVDRSWILEVEVSDLEGTRSANRSWRVRPSCRQVTAEGQAACVCECKANYSFGKCT